MPDGLYSSDVSAGDDATATQHNNLRTDIKRGMSDVLAPAVGATTTLDLSTGKNFDLEIDEDTEITFTNPRVGQWFAVQCKQTNGGGHGVTFASGMNIKYPSDTPPTPTATVDAIDVFVFYCEDSATPRYRCFFAGFDVR